MGVVFDCRYAEGLKWFFRQVLVLGDFIRTKLEEGDEVSNYRVGNI